MQKWNPTFGTQFRPQTTDHYFVLCPEWVDPMALHRSQLVETAIALLVNIPSDLSRAALVLLVTHQTNEKVSSLFKCLCQVYIRQRKGHRAGRSNWPWPSAGGRTVVKQLQRTAYFNLEASLGSFLQTLCPKWK